MSDSGARIALGAASVLFVVLVALVLWGRRSTPADPVEASPTPALASEPGEIVEPGPIDLPAGTPDLRRNALGHPRVQRPPCRPFGRVTWEDGTAAEGAEIEVLDQGADFGKYNLWTPTGVFTSSTGNYELPHQEGCPLRLGATLPGRGRGEEKADPLPRNARVPYDMERDIIMERAVSVAGRVVDDEDRPIDGAMVSASRAWLDDPEDLMNNALDREAWGMVGMNMAYADTTGPDGGFELRALTLDTWALTAEAEGYEPVKVELEHLGKAAPGFTEIRLQPARCWTVRVNDETREPIGGAEVLVSAGLQTHFAFDEAVTNGTGVAEICSVAATGANLSVKAPGHLQAHVHNDDGLLELVVDLEPAASLHGVVAEPSLCPGPARVFLGIRQDFHWEEATVDADCDVTFDHLPVGESEVRVTFDWRFHWKGVLDLQVGGGAPVSFDDLQPLEVHPSNIWSTTAR